ncbi:MAG: site-specific DNA-methyltransferase [Flavobacteriaceae bacterium]|nr:site-specific DNA-methyltransferase [Flavobacteriaceae bacterium]
MISETFNIDCIEGMKQYPDKYFDLAVCDPPYGIDRNNMQMGNSKINKDNKQWDSNIPNEDYFNELFRVSKNQIIWGGNYFPLPNSQYFAIWDKGETMYGRDFAECEYAWVRNGGTRIFKLSPNQPDRFHPTQKPIALYEWIFTNYAKEGFKILDSHLGSQSSRIAAYKAKLDFIGFELDKEYFEQGNQRFEEFKIQFEQEIGTEKILKNQHRLF